MQLNDHLKYMKKKNDTDSIEYRIGLMTDILGRMCGAASSSNSVRVAQMRARHNLLHMNSDIIEKVASGGYDK